MPNHVNMEYLTIGLAMGFAFRFVVLFAFLWVMIQIQKFQYELLPLIGAAFAAAALDMIPFVGHYMALPVLYFCIWKITRASLFPEAVFTVGLSYASTYCLTLILLAYAPVPGYHPKSARNTNYDLASLAPMPVEQSTNQPEQPAQPPQTISVPENKIAAGISVKGLSGSANDAMVTIQYGKKDYIISLGEGTTISTDEGLATVHFVKADGNHVTLSVSGQEVKYALK
jgi:hypothetical protein